MNIYMEFAVMLGICFILDYSIRRYAWRKWGGLMIFAAGWALIFVPSYLWFGLDSGLLSLALIVTGMTMFSSRRKFEEDAD